MAEVETKIMFTQAHTHTHTHTHKIDYFNKLKAKFYASVINIYIYRDKSRLPLLKHFSHIDQTYYLYIKMYFIMPSQIKTFIEAYKIKDFILKCAAIYQFMSV